MKRLHIPKINLFSAVRESWRSMRKRSRALNRLTVIHQLVPILALILTILGTIVAKFPNIVSPNPPIPLGKPALSDTGGIVPPQGCTVESPIAEKYNQLGGASGFLGRCIKNARVNPGGDALYQNFEGGMIHWRSGIGAFETHGSIWKLWESMGWEASWLGLPRSDETVVGQYHYNQFDGGFIYWSLETGAYAVRGPAYQLPFDRTLVGQYGCSLTSPHHDYAAWDCPMDEGNTITTPMEGQVGYVGGTCGNGIKIVGVDGFVYKFCHGSERLVNDGATVRSGDPVMKSGNTGSSFGPHLHMEILRDGVNLCPQAVLTDWYNYVPTPPDRNATTGCSY